MEVVVEIVRFRKDLGDHFLMHRGGGSKGKVKHRGLISRDQTI